MPVERKASLAEKVYDDLHEAIIQGNLPPGTVVYEGDLTRQFAVSNSPVREALTRLRHEGLIKVIPRKGYMVTEISLHDVQELLQLRLILECAAAEVAAVSATDDQLARLGELAAVKVVAGDVDSYRAYSKANHAFHRFIADISGNGRFVRLLEQVLGENQRILYMDVGFELESLNEGHPELVRALATRDPQTARKAMARHVEESRQRILEQLLGHPGYFAISP